MKTFQFNIENGTGKALETLLALVVERYPVQVRQTLTVETESEEAEAILRLNQPEDGIGMRLLDQEVAAPAAKPAEKKAPVTKLASERKNGRKKEATFPDRTCIYCGKTYRPHRHDQKVCNQACRKEYGEKKLRIEKTVGSTAGPAVEPGVWRENAEEQGTVLKALLSGR